MLLNYREKSLSQDLIVSNANLYYIITLNLDTSLNIYREKNYR